MFRAIAGDIGAGREEMARVRRDRRDKIKTWYIDIIENEVINMESDGFVKEGTIRMYRWSTGLWSVKEKWRSDEREIREWIAFNSEF
jgi:hypothetical protein